MGKLPTLATIMQQVTATMQSTAERWQQFYQDAGTPPGVDSARLFNDLVGTTSDWMNVWATMIGAGGSPTPPTIFILGSPWPYTAATKSGTARLEVPVDPATTVSKTSTLVLLGGGTNTYPLTLSVGELRESGSQAYIEVTRSNVSGHDPASGMHAGALFTDGETLLATVQVWVP